MNSNRNISWKNRKNLGIAVFVSLFLLIFTPFDIQQWSYPERLYYVIGYGLCTLLGMYAWDVIKPFLFERIRRYEASKKQLIFSFAVLLIISLLNFIYSRLIGVINLSMQGFLLFLGITVAVGIFPSLWVYYESRRHHEKEKEAETPEKASTESKAMVQLKGDNQDERLTIAENNLLFIKAALNYSEVFFLKEGKLEREILRISMNRVEVQLEQIYICRTHRSYICNLRNVDQVNRRNKGLLLGFAQTEETACCSRKYKSAIQKKLGHLQGDSSEQKLRPPVRQDGEYTAKTTSHSR